MTDEKLFSLISKFQRDLNSHDLTIVTNFLRDKEDEHFLFLQTLSLKNPTIGIVFSWVFGYLGIGAFYANKMSFGIAQLVSYIAFIGIYMGLPLAYGWNESQIYDFWFGGYYNYDYTIWYGDYISKVEGLFLVVSLIAYIVFFVIGVVNAQKWVKEYNFKKIMEYLPKL